MSTTTIHDVEICRVGNWASTLSGRVPITDDDVNSMVAAAADPEVDHAPLKLGHVDPRFDGEPALGWIANVRNVAGTVLADLTDVPEKMADVIRSAFKRRSAEISWGVKTPSGKQYRAALSGLALLGVTPPAVKGLADITSRYSGATYFSTVEVNDMDPSEEAWAAFNQELGLSRHPAGSARSGPRSLPYTGDPAVPVALAGDQYSEADWDEFNATLRGLNNRKG